MLALALAALATLPPAVAWQTFDTAAFDAARASGRLVILDVGTGWCHWCHVMDQRTYGDPAVAARLAHGFVVARADADARLDLAQRYEDWGWPATIVFDAEGRELLRLKGFIAPERFARILDRVRADPTPDPALREPTATAAGGAIPPDARAQLEARWEKLWEPAHAGWGHVHKYLHGPSIELALARAARGDQIQRARAAATLEANLALLDPVEGGAFQYSDRSDDERPWSSPHYEKIMAAQATNLRGYTLGARLLDRPAFAEAARGIARYLSTVLSSPEGGFYASQDADVRRAVPGKRYYGATSLAARRELGAPRVDRATYARETGQAIAALADASGLLDDAALLARARAGAAWARAHRRRADGTYRHGDDDARYLGDTLAMGQAALALYQATADRAELAEAVRAVEALDGWRIDGGGVASAPVPVGARGALAHPTLNIDENVEVARLANVVAQVSGSTRARALAEHTMRALAAPAVTASRRFPSGLLLADDETTRAPLHLTVVGAKDDPRAARLFAAARAQPVAYRRVEWLDRREGPLPAADVTYPELPYPAAFVCADGACSRPVREPSEVAAAVAKVLPR